MPLHWDIDHTNKFMVVVAEGMVTRQEADRMLDALIAERALGYRRLFDGTQGDTTMGPSEMLDLGVRMRTLHQHGTMGPLAVVVPADKWEMVARVLGMLAAAKRPMRVFQTVAKARRWLKKHEPVSPATETTS